MGSSGRVPSRLSATLRRLGSCVSSGHVRVVRVIEWAPEAVGEGGRAAARGQEGCCGVENSVSDAEFWAQKRKLSGDRAGMVTHLAPAEAKTKVDEGGGWRLEAGELGHESLFPVQLFQEFAMAEA